MPQRDIQAELGVINAGNIAVLTASVPEEVLGSVAIDTQGMRGIMFFALFSSVLTAGDQINLKVYESDTSGGTYTEVATDKMLPSRREPNQFASVTGPTSPFLQTWGAFGTKRFVKPQFTTAVLTANEDADIFAVYRNDARPVDEWDPDYTTQDGNP